MFLFSNRHPQHRIITTENACHSVYAKYTQFAK